MHCLDMVRQYTYRDEYDYSDNPTFQDDDEFLRSVSLPSSHPEGINADEAGSMWTIASKPSEYDLCATLT